VERRSIGIVLIVVKISVAGDVKLYRKTVLKLCKFDRTGRRSASACTHIAEGDLIPQTF
jgi:hypothetical protein